MYGIRLYELCLQWSTFSSEREFEIYELRELLGLKEKYPFVNSFKNKVILPAIDDINKFTSLHVEYGQRKRGKQITHIQFTISGDKKASSKLTKKKRKSMAKAESLEKREKAVEAFCRKHPRDTIGKSTNEILKMMASVAR